MVPVSRIRRILGRPHKLVRGDEDHVSLKLWSGCCGGLCHADCRPSTGGVDPWARQLTDDMPKLEFGPEMVLVAIHRISDCQGPGLYDCLAILGREKSLARIARALPLCG